MKKLALHWQITIALVSAILFGIYLPEHIQYISWTGIIFLRALKMIIVPLVLTSVISGIANIGDSEALGKIGIKTLSYYFATSIAAILTGLLLVNLLQPGVGSDLGFTKKIEGIDQAQKSFGSTLYEIVPTNIFDAFANNQMLSVVFFALLTGFCITKLSNPSKTFLFNGANAGFELMMRITTFIIQFAPIGVFGLVATTISEQAGDTDALIGIAQRLGLYALTVLLALAVHAIVTLSLFLKIIGKINPIKHVQAMAVPLLTAFSTSSSAATLSLTIDAVEKNAGVSKKTSSFVLPLGSTINMDGTALYECVAVLFIAQAYGITLDFSAQVIVVITTLLSSIGGAGIPMAGLVMMSIVLSAVGLPLEGIGLILAVDRILDMVRTTVNVYSDSCGAVIIAKLEAEKIYS